jgi:hypothetical protein
MPRAPIRRLLRQSDRCRLTALVVVATSLFLPAGGANASGPSITPVIRGTLGSNGWYVSNVTVNWVIDPLPDSSSGCDAFTLTADTPGTSRTCSATWGSTTINYTLTIKIDKTPPTVGGALSRQPDANGWYNHPLPISFSGSDALSGLASCSSPTYSGPDRADAVVSGSCRDNAGNTAGAAVSFDYDATAPTVTAGASRQPDANGWYNHLLTVSFSGSDGTSGLAGCSAAASYSGPDSSGAAVYGTCTDKAGNTGTGALSFPYDATPPTAVKGTLSRQPDANGWYNHALPISFSGTDGMSGLASCSSPTYSGPDRADAVVSGSCRDNAGNTASAAVSFDYDATAPTVKAAASRQPDANGWFNHPLTISFSGSDSTSGLTGCSSAASYSGPDTAGAAVYGTCTDKAGNTGTGALSFPYDATPPTAKGTVGRAPDANGWYNHPLPISFSGSDALSGLASCSSPTYSGPDTAGAAVSGSCVDKAGNTTSSSVSFDYDATPPVVTVAAGRVPDANGWYNHALTVSFSGSDATSGLAGCSPAATYGGPDNAGAAAYGSCWDNAGNTGTGKLAFKYDATPPTAKGTVGRSPDANGWYNHPLTVSFSGTDATSGLAGCSSASYSGPDDPRAAVAGSCRDSAGNTTSAAVSLEYDATPPAVRGTTSRPPDANGWYNHPLKVVFSAGDATSGVASCSSATYSGPDSAGAAVSGSCRDTAGNIRSAVVAFKYDATPPTLRKITVKHFDRSVLIRWEESSDTQHTEVVRSPGMKGERQTMVYSGAEAAFRDTHLRPGRKYRYTVIASDAAANVASKSLAVTATGPLLDPTPGEHVSSPPRLVWTRVKGATYYNVQLLRGGRRILSEWPRRASLQLARNWVYKGRHYRLRAGLYQWYVWPGFGLLAQARYGQRLGGSSFVVG